MIGGMRDARLATNLGGKYRIVRLVGQGGMGTVYEALHIVVKRRFAVKFLRADLAQRRDALSRFQREAAAAGTLESENIAQAVDFGIADDGAPYIVMEYLVGCDLARLLKCIGPVPLERAADLVIQACNGTQAAHDAGVIHRDLKPANLYICRRSDGSDLVKIVDFGIAKLAAADAGNTITSTGGIVGTPAYMSPEQARGSSLLDERADVYALGVILYELLTGHTPHPGDSHNAVIYHISTQPPLPLAVEVPPEFAQIVMRALSINSEERHASAAAFARQLTPFARRDTWPIIESIVSTDETMRASAPPLLPADAVSLERSPTTKPAVYSRPPRNARSKWSAIVFGAAAVLALAAAGIATRAKAVANAQRASSVTEASPQEPSRVFSAMPQAKATPTTGSQPLLLERAPATDASSVDSARATVAANAKRPLPTTSDRQRPSDSRGRPSGHAPLLGGPSAAAANSAGLTGVHATFDSKNPYE